MATALRATPALAADQTWTGTISDSACGASHKKMPGADATKLSDGVCTLASVQKAANNVFMHDGKVFQIENQDFETLQKHAGYTVLMAGEVSGDSITVSKVEMPAAKEESAKPSPLES